MTTEPVRQPKGIRVGGRFAEKQNSPSPVALDLPQDATPRDAAGPDLNALSEARDKLREARDEAADNNNPEHVLLDQQVQRMSVQLAAASIRSRYPEAQSLILRENEGGEQQYDVLGVYDDLGSPVPDTDTGSDWTRDEVSGENSANLEELSWALNPRDDTWADGIAEITTSREYGKTAKIDIDAAMALAAPQPAPAAPDVAEMAEARDALMEKWEDHPRDSPDFEHIDQQMQHAAVQLAAAAVRRDYPAAKTLVIRENDDGENQYDPIAINDGSGRPIVDLEDDDDWTRDEVAGENTVNLSELSWTLNLEDDAWAGGIAEISTTKRDGKTAVIDIDAALAKPAPQHPTSKAALVQRYSDAQDATAAARRQHRAARELDQHAAVQLAAASILERYPEADTLHLRESVDEPGGPMYVHSLSGPNGEIAHSNDGDDFQYEPGEDGTPDLAELLRDLDTSSMTWCEGISEVESDKHNGYQVALNLKAALAKPAPSAQE